jgi:putative transposase
MEKSRKHTRQAGEITENWRQQYNKVRPHSSLGDRPPTPEAILPLQVASA